LSIIKIKLLKELYFQLMMELEVSNLVS